MENTTYNLTDLQTGKIINTYTHAQRNRARNRADKLNLEYGAHRYAANPVFQADDESVFVGMWDGFGLIDPDQVGEEKVYKIDFSKVLAGMGSN